MVNVGRNRDRRPGRRSPFRDPKHGGRGRLEGNRVNPNERGTEHKGPGRRGLGGGRLHFFVY